MFIFVTISATLQPSAITGLCTVLIARAKPSGRFRSNSVKRRNFFSPLFLCIFMPRLNSTFVFSLWMWNRSVYLLLFLFICRNIHRSTWLLRIEPVSSKRRRELLFVTSWKYLEMNLKSGACNGWLPLCVVAGEGEEEQESEVSGELCFLSQRWLQRAWQQTIKG